MKVLSSDDAFNLSNLLKDGDWMVLYYAEWCGHCNAMKPEWEKFITKMKDPNVNSTNIKIADVKSDFIADIQQKPEIPGFPTIKMYSNGKEVADFKDDRIAEKMVEFAKSNTKTSNKKVSNKQASNKKNNTIQPEPVIVDATAVEPETAKDTKEELPMIAINTPPSVDILSHKSTHKSTHKPSRKSNNKARKTTPKSTHKVSAMKHSAKPIKMDDLLEMPKEETPALVPVPAVQQSFANVPCNEIRKAKHCKSNPKCMFDYPGNKCVVKSLPAIPPLEKQNAVKSIVVHKSKIKTKKNQKTQKTKVSKNRVANNNIKKSTKEVFGKLVQSFDRISNEAKKDAKILKTASAKL